MRAGAGAAIWSGIGWLAGDELAGTLVGGGGWLEEAVGWRRRLVGGGGWLEEAEQWWGEAG
jgi:hypothetical protein